MVLISSRRTWLINEANGRMTGKQYRFNMDLVGIVEAKDDDEAKTWFEHAKQDAIAGIIDGSSTTEMGKISVLVSRIDEWKEPADDENDDDDDDESDEEWIWKYR